MQEFYQTPSVNNFKIPLDILGGNKFGRYKKISPQETFNMIVTDDCITNFSGHKKVLYIDEKQGRGIYSSSRLNKIILIADNNVYSIDTNLSTSLVGKLDTLQGDISIAENLNNEIIISDGSKLYNYNYGIGSFNKLNVDFLPGYVSFQDGYFICAVKNRHEWRLSKPNDGNNFPVSGGFVGEIETKATNCIACIPFDRQLFVFGTNVCEIWKNVGNVGNSPFPYQRSGSLVIDYGCINPATIAVGFSKIVWLASNEKSNVCIRVSEGGKSERISTDGLDAILSNLKNPEQAFGFMYQIDGHVFYQITFTKDNLSYLFDFNTNKFYTLTDYDLSQHHIAKRVVFFNGSNYFISFKDGDLYEMSSSYYDYNGNEMPTIIILNNIRKEDGQFITCQQLNIIMEQGFNKGEQAINLSISKDGGESFGSIYKKILNSYGKRRNICNFYNLGMSNEFCFKYHFLGLGRKVICSSTGYFY